MRNFFSRQERISSKTDIRRVLEKGKKKRGAYFICSRFPNNEGCDRYGFLIPKRFGNAVQRNRIKRVLRESVRTCEEKNPPFFDFLFQPRMMDCTVYRHNREWEEELQKWLTNRKL